MRNRRYRDSEIQSHKETENQRDRETEDTKDSEDVPVLATRIQTIQEAVEIALKEGVGENCLFVFARALKAYEATTGTRLDPQGLDGAFALWWSKAKPQLPAGAEFDEYRFLFQDAFARAKSPLGANHFNEALKLAKLQPLPPEASHYSSPKLRLLVAVCFQLQRMAGTGPFYLSTRQAAQILDTKNLHNASAMRDGLVTDGILKIVEAGKPGGIRATRYRYLERGTPRSEAPPRAPK